MSFPDPAPLPRLVLRLETGAGSEDLATWALYSNDAIDDPDGTHNISKAVQVLNVYEPGGPVPPE